MLSIEQYIKITRKNIRSIEVIINTQILIIGINRKSHFLNLNSVLYRKENSPITLDLNMPKW